MCWCDAELQHYKPADVVLASCEYLKLALVSVLEIYVQTHETPSVQGWCPMLARWYSVIRMRHAEQIVKDVAAVTLQITVNNVTFIQQHQ